MVQVRFSLRALQNIADILDWSGDEFGLAARARYERLIRQAVDDLAENPERFGTKAAKGFEPIRIFHLRHSRLSGSASADRVRSPRHLIAYRPVGPDIIEIVCVIHDAMDLKRYLPKP
ncbi:type II toxin-antitoxin system RelE/ParE family toxin [Aerophototrophica crusticola]|uniref:Type II toxin-antitoxin system RelE/ParE family toxin n=1 Tax=Aerophototrophica crusticola TaxID=1709002 RepID=A0A858R4D6_9PROT|nr:type II toxin-antitoxin system RelE/ParE family toxin [Rhodospirillaceae bacterium B3]